MRQAALILGLVLALPAGADAPGSSPRPIARPVAEAAAPQGGEAPKEKRGLFAKLKKKDGAGAPGADAAEAPTEAEAEAAPEQTAAAAPAEAKPKRKPKGLGRLLGRAAQPAPKRYPIKGSVCNDRTIRGKEVGRVNGKGACGISNAVRITEVGGVSLSSPALVECTTAHSLNAWVQNVARPAMDKKGGGLASMKLLSSYACRTRNSRPGAKLSEHAKGRAVDIGAFTLQDGTQVTVLKGWRDKTFGPILVEMHAGACGRFGTVLGPKSDRFHQDHFHFDTARYRSGPYCR